MLTRRTLLGAAAPLAAGLGGCTVREYLNRYRLSLDVETPTGLVTGSSVFEMRVRDNLTFPNEYPILRAARGEATVVPIPGGGLLVALLVSPAWDMSQKSPRRVAPTDQPWWPELAFAEHWGIRTMNRYRDALERLKGVAATPDIEVTRFRAPAMVCVRRPEDPDSIVVVDPANIASAFGEGVSLRSARLSLTAAPLTSTIIARLPWVADEARRRVGWRVLDEGPVYPEVVGEIFPISAFKEDAFS